MCRRFSDLSQDEAFVDEIRSGLRFIASVLLRRIQKAVVLFGFIKFIVNVGMQCKKASVIASAVIQFISFHATQAGWSSGCSAGLTTRSRRIHSTASLFLR